MEQLNFLPITEHDYKRLRDYCVALEGSRRDLMSVNEELREKITSLERGQEDLISRWYTPKKDMFSPAEEW